MLGNGLLFKLSKGIFIENGRPSSSLIFGREIYRAAETQSKEYFGVALANNGLQFVSTIVAGFKRSTTFHNSRAYIVFHSDLGGVYQRVRSQTSCIRVPRQNSLNVGYLN
jgi:hypothetical protein